MSRVYDPFMAPLERLGLARWRGRLAGPCEGSVLEIGTGTGLNLPHYRLANVVVATDRDAGMLLRAVERAGRAKVPVSLLCADAHDIPFGDAAFDTAVSALSFCTIPEPERAFAEVRRVLKPGGTLRMLEHVRAPHSLAAGWQDMATPAWRRVSGGCHLNRATLETAQSAGFEQVEVRRSLFGWLLFAVLRRL